MKTMIMTVAFLAFCSGREARANGDKLDMKQLKLALLSVAPAYFANVVIHEGSHAVAALSMGMKVEDFMVFPQMVDGQFYFGYHNASRQREPSNTEKAFYYIMPQITAITLFSLAEIGFETGFISHRSDAAAIIFVMFEVAPLVNLFTYVLGGSTGAIGVDPVKFENATGISPALNRGVGLAIGAVGLALMIRRAQKIFWKKEAPKKPGRYQCDVAANDGTIGLAVKF